MIHRFDRMETTFSNQLMEMKRTFRRDIRGLRQTVTEVIDTLAEVDQELKNHKRDTRAHN